MSKLLDSIFASSDINEITEMVSTHLKKPIVVESGQFSLLAYSSYYIDHFDEANQQTIFAKRWPIPILEKFMDEGIVERLRSAEGPFRLPKIEDIGLNPRVVASTKHKGEIFGYIWVQETDPPLTEEEMDFLTEVSLHIGKLLYRENQLKTLNDERKTRFYKNVFDDMYKTESQIKWEAANANIVLPSSFIVTAFTAANQDEDLFLELAETIRLFVNALNRPSHVLVAEMKVIVIIGSSLTGDTTLTRSARQLASTVLSQFKPFTLYAGIGSQYSSIPELRKSYQEALKVIETAKFLGTPAIPDIEYRNLGVFRYLEAIARYDGGKPEIHEDLLKLQQKDKENQSSLLQTLEAYLQNNCRIKPTAEQLFIHPNTLKYRLKQIADTTSIRFNNFNMNCRLYIDLQLMKR